MKKKIAHSFKNSHLKGAGKRSKDHPPHTGTPTSEMKTRPTHDYVRGQPSATERDQAEGEEEIIDEALRRDSMRSTKAA